MAFSQPITLACVFDSVILLGLLKLLPFDLSILILDK